MAKTAFLPDHGCSSGNHGKENAVERFVAKHQAHITGTISCFDRILFKGHLPLGWPDAMEGFISRQGLRIKDFGRFVSRHSEQIKQHARAMAEQARRTSPNPSPSGTASPRAWSASWPLSRPATASSWPTGRASPGWSPPGASVCASTSTSSTVSSVSCTYESRPGSRS